MTRTRKLALVAGALGILALGLFLARPSTRESGTDHVVYFLRLPGTGPEPSDSRRAIGASLRGEPLPPGTCFVLLQPALGLDWNGRRSRDIEVRSALGALLEVRLESEGRLLARLKPGTDTWRVPLRLEGRLLGARPFRLTVRTRDGELEPFETEIPGLLATPAEWLESLRTKRPAPGE